ncbi:hypothetical protein VN12_06415 [Pirellula sp. SH-Sr6A]|uniref:hypothetical protein n=1 Tax=Pirellula sp. SH-Sr6A TaxID=1632865 RepID=UPI00078BAFE8|nr:hypothetical protein [Pirellula sp. SH-Sr6A]AMV31736.1 hypothetical protein VN12_06415 [Pirellula sp. SH-Sr6A]
MTVFTGYAIQRERREEIRSTAINLPFTVRDYTPPEEIDPRQLVRHDLQGNMGSCGGFGSTNCGERLFIYAMGESKYSAERQFSPLFQYLEAQRFDDLIGRDDGSTIAGHLRAAREVGYCPLRLCPYVTPYPRNARSLITAEMRKAAEPYRIQSHTWCESYDDCFNYLASRVGTLLFGTSWNDSFYAPNGQLERVRFTRFDGGHAYAVLGYSKRKDSRGRNYLWRLNSHQDSYTEISPAAIDQMCAHPYTAIVGMSDLSTPRPRNVDFSKESVIG